mmetsp:Transcript_63014/g.95103  ORF Transcript_63014/g.95103 Transcript_63014/m.95103 type:complete len:377 (+) Transcript_63014:1620-2750(+)
MLSKSSSSSVVSLCLFSSWVSFCEKSNPTSPKPSSSSLLHFSSSENLSSSLPLDGAGVGSFNSKSSSQTSSSLPSTSGTNGVGATGGVSSGASQSRSSPNGSSSSSTGAGAGTCFFVIGVSSDSLLQAPSSIVSKSKVADFGLGRVFGVTSRFSSSGIIIVFVSSSQVPSSYSGVIRSRTFVFEGKVLPTGSLPLEVKPEPEIFLDFSFSGTDFDFSSGFSVGAFSAFDFESLDRLLSARFFFESFRDFPSRGVFGFEDFGFRLSAELSFLDRFFSPFPELSFLDFFDFRRGERILLSLLARGERIFSSFLRGEFTAGINSFPLIEIVFVRSNSSLCSMRQSFTFSIFKGGSICAFDLIHGCFNNLRASILSKGSF